MGVCFENEIKMPVKRAVEIIKSSNPDFSRLIVIKNYKIKANVPILPSNFFMSDESPKPILVVCKNHQTKNLILIPRVLRVKVSLYFGPSITILGFEYHDTLVRVSRYFGQSIALL